MSGASVPDLHARLRPEFINRIDLVAGFRPLASADVAALVRHSFDEIARTLLQRDGITLHVGPGVVEQVARAGASVEFGVRHLQRTIEALIEAPLLQRLRDPAVERCAAVSLALEGGAIVFKLEPA